MVDLILILLLLCGFLIGLRRGLVLQIVHLSGFIVSLIMAYVFFDDLAPKLKLWIPYPNLGDGTSTVLSILNVEDIYYKGIAFAILFFGTKIAMHILGSMLDFLADLPILRTINGWLGGVLGFLEIYLIVFIFLYIAAIIPNESLQNTFNNSFIAQIIIKHTPYFSAHLQELWLS
ncbi:CvpA family protein [Pueribacillus sp. YX66]|uniref:CvpA family protein n=1 Tax=Pueribacillus sp. YX66 TaxID=3229242 RepID=UPI00358D58EB